ncbi:ribonuclease [Tsuneonella sp. HG249]
MSWIVEQGIGEERALRYENGRAVAARMRWLGELEPGLVADAVLVERARGSARGRARFESGEEALVDHLPGGITEGQTLRLEVSRAAFREDRRGKLAQARPTAGECRDAPTLAETLEAEVVRHFPDDAWQEIWAEAADGVVDFPGGSLHFAPTAAMTLVDVDGHLPPRELALAAVEPIAWAIDRFALAGSLGIDFPTLTARGDRKSVDAALGVALSHWDHERTAMNGFGFVQLVARSERPSILHRLRFQPADAAARLLLRQGELLDRAGAIALTAAPRVLDRIGPDWLAELGRRAGRSVRLAPDPSLASTGGHAQIVPL